MAGAGLSGAKEAPGFRAGALQPRPPINPLLTEARRGPNEAECFLDERSLVRHGDRGCLSLTKLLPTDDLDPHGFNFLFHGGVGEYSPVVITQKVAASDALQFGIVIAAMDNHLSHTGLQIAKCFEIPFLPHRVVFAFVELKKIVNWRQALRFQNPNSEFSVR